MLLEKVLHLFSPAVKGKDTGSPLDGTLLVWLQASGQVLFVPIWSFVDKLVRIPNSCVFLLIFIIRHLRNCIITINIIHLYIYLHYLSAGYSVFTLYWSVLIYKNLSSEDVVVLVKTVGRL